MTSRLKAALCATAMIACAPAAHAASFTRYDISLTGTVYTSRDMIPVAQRPTDALISIIAPLTTRNPYTFFAGDPLDGFLMKSGTYTYGSSLWTFSESHLQHAFSATYNISLCPVDGITPTCGSASFTLGGSDGIHLQQISFGGIVTRIVSTTFDVDPSQTPFGVVAATVPEPSTWALMFAGFGMAGYALRRRKARAAVA